MNILMPSKTTQEVEVELHTSWLSAFVSSDRDRRYAETSLYSTKVKIIPLSNKRPGCSLLKLIKPQKNWQQIHNITPDGKILFITWGRVVITFYNYVQNLVHNSGSSNVHGIKFSITNTTLYIELPSSHRKRKRVGGGEEDEIHFIPTGLSVAPLSAETQIPGPWASACSSYQKSITKNIDITNSYQASISCKYINV